MTVTVTSGGNVHDQPQSRSDCCCRVEVGDHARNDRTTGGLP